MITLYLLTLLLITMFLLPIITSSLSSELDEEILTIAQMDTKDPRFFAKSFKKKLRESVINYQENGEFKMSRVEDFYIEENEQLPSNIEYDVLMLSGNDVKYGDNTVFNKEVYINGSITTKDNTTLRSLLATGGVSLGKNSEIIRWVDGEQYVDIGDNGSLGLSVSSEKKLIIGKNCTFRRLYAPTIQFGKEIEIESVAPVVKINNEILRDSKLIIPDEVTGNRVIDNTIVTKNDLRISNGMTINGAITSHGNIIIEPNCVIHGNIFAEKNIYIRSGVKIYGILFSQENIDISTNVTIGIHGKIKSIVARGDIIIDSNTIVHGYISCEKQGKTR